MVSVASFGDRVSVMYHRMFGHYAPNFEKSGDILVTACPYVCVFVCIHVRDIVLKLHVWIPHGKIADAYFWFSLN